MGSIVFKTKIKGETLRNRKLKNLDGREVKVVVTEIESKEKRKWLKLGSVALGGALDKQNIRDYAYE